MSRVAGLREHDALNTAHFAVAADKSHTSLLTRDE